MRRKQRRTLLSTTITIFISLNMQVRRENRAELITLPLLHLTPLLVWIWQISRLLTILTQPFDPFDWLRTQRWGSLAVTASRWLIRGLDQLAYHLDIGLTLASIGLRSVLYGLGAPL
jgi:hypothetical protein